MSETGLLYDVTGETDAADARAPLALPDGPLPGVLTDTGYALPEGLSWEEWEAIGRRLQRAHRAILWWIGDYLRYGERRWGEMYAQAVEATGYAEQTLMNAVFVCGKFPVSRRRENLSFTAHAEAAGLPEDEADALLDMAEAEHLSSRDVRERARARKHELGLVPLPSFKPEPATVACAACNGTGRVPAGDEGDAA